MLSKLLSRFSLVGDWGVFPLNIKVTMTSPKMQPNLFCSCVQLTENYSVLNLNSLYTVRLAVVVKKSGFMHPET